MEGGLHLREVGGSDFDRVRVCARARMRVRVCVLACARRARVCVCAHARACVTSPGLPRAFPIGPCKRRGSRGCVRRARHRGLRRPFPTGPRVRRTAAVVVCRDHAARALSVSFAYGTRPPCSPDRDALLSKEMVNRRESYFGEGSAREWVVTLHTAHRNPFPIEAHPAASHKIHLELR